MRRTHMRAVLAVVVVVAVAAVVVAAVAAVAVVTAAARVFSYPFWIKVGRGRFVYS